MNQVPQYRFDLSNLCPSSIRAFFNGLMIFYYSIMNNQNFSVSRQMRVCILIIWLSVSSPSGMPYTYMFLSFQLLIAFERFSTFPFFLTIFKMPFEIAIPALSYPRYSSLFSPSIIIGKACSLPL